LQRRREARKQRTRQVADVCCKTKPSVGSSQLWRCFRRCCRTLSHKRRRCRFGLILLNVPVPRIHMSEKSANRRSAPSVQTRGHGVRRSYRQCFTSDTFSLLGRLIAGIYYGIDADITGVIAGRAGPETESAEQSAFLGTHLMKNLAADSTTDDNFGVGRDSGAIQFLIE
jgi:hypothetical protein